MRSVGFFNILTRFCPHVVVVLAILFPAGGRAQPAAEKLFELAALEKPPSQPPELLSPTTISEEYFDLDSYLADREGLPQNFLPCEYLGAAAPWSVQVLPAGLIYKPYLASPTGSNKAGIANIIHGRR